MSVRKKCNLARVNFILVCTVLVGQGRSQDVGSFLAGLLGATDVLKNQTVGEQNQMPCPGQCVHALTSILCSKVIEQFNCGAGYLRCCVSSDFAFGTVVETSAPLPEEASTEAGEYDLFLLPTVPNSDSTTKQQHPISTAVQTVHQPKPTPQTVETHSIIINSKRKPRPCTGICVENIFVRYCSGTVPDGICEKGSTCCASNQDDIEPPTPIHPTTTITTSSSTPATTITTEKAANAKPHSNQLADAPTLATTLPGPPCPGSCVASLFSLLCDAVDDNYYCGNDGRCCVNNDEIAPEPTTTTPLSQVSVSCPATCIPIFLSSMCNMPSELISLTDCDADFICCYQPEIKDHLHIGSPQIPLLRPIVAQPGYPSIPISQNAQPVHQPSITHTYAQRPQVPVVSNPIIMPHIHNQGSGSQIFAGKSIPVFPSPPIQAPKPPLLPPPPPSHDGPSIIKVPYQPNNNYGGSLYQPPNFVPVIQKQNSSHELQPIRLSVLAPLNQPVSSHTDEFFPKRKPNISQTLPQHSQPIPAALYPPKDKDSEPLRLISPPTSVGEISPPHSDELRKQQNVHDRFVETAIGFSPDTLRPIGVNVPKKTTSFRKILPTFSSPFI